MLHHIDFMNYDIDIILWMIVQFIYAISSINSKLLTAIVEQNSLVLIVFWNHKFVYTNWDIQNERIQ